MKIGIVGENFENDSKPMRILLEKKYDNSICQFIPLLPRFKGSQLENISKATKELNTAIRKRKLDFIIFLRDLDAHPNNQKEIKKRNNWFDKLNKETGKNNLFFLIIYELESLIFSDIDTFNKKYKTKLSLKGNPLFIEDPKGKLIAASLGKNQYDMSHAQDIFKELNFTKIQTKHHHKEHPCFHSFIEELDQKFKKN